MNNHENSENRAPILDITTKGTPWGKENTLTPLFKKTLLTTLQHAFENPHLPPTFKKFQEHSLEISLLLAHNPFVQKLNKKWLSKDMPTNVISFPFYEKGEDLSLDNFKKSNEQVFLGDIVLSYEKCLEEANLAEKPFMNHISHLFTHGILHLLGFDHLTEHEAHIMESLEITILADLQIPNPYTHGISKNGVDLEC